ncbi:beta/alpha barrel domain-containing protein [Mycolicibacterium mengxianglii]|uniref:ribulose phosphate epimerase n=1 Tax=Mycolicibacterium mengxianglii TaxID=2736649 RepID=UPI0018EF26F3|nr:ribulose phosphate epimerase [Mycolicibacterium mengxianglii]
MMATQLLAPWHERFPGQLAGSVYAAPTETRIIAAQELSAAGLDVHVDVMAESEGLPTGVGLDELDRIAAAVDTARVGVHVIGSPGFVDTVLSSVLAVRPAVVFVPWDAFSAERVATIRTAGSQAWVALWQEWDGADEASIPEWPTTPDGVLVMLIQPGTRDQCALGRLAIVTACAGELPVAVDGGVTESVAELCVSAGASSIVVGRALFAGPSAASTEGTP